MSSSPLRVTIAGAGIGGLACALALRRQGHIVTLVEKSHFAMELGAAVHMAINVTENLRRLGVNLEAHGGVTLRGYASRDSSGKLLGRVLREEVNDPNLAQPQLIHRAHLHTALKDAVLSPEGAGTPAVLLLASPIESVDPETATVTIKGGKTVEGDAVIGADGVHSVTRKFLPGSEGIEPHGSGWSAFRFLLEREAVAAHPDAADLFTDKGMLVMANAEPDATMIMYPCASDKLLNFVVTCPSERVGTIHGDKGDFNTVANKQQMLDLFGSCFTGGPRAVLDMAPADTLKLWVLQDMADLPTWATGRLACIGDAAHPFLPFRGQGAAMAIEDGVSIGAMLAPDTPAAAVPARLQLYQKARRERAMFVQDLTRNATKTKMVERDSDGSTKSSMHNLEKDLLKHNEYTHSRAILNESLAVGGA